jgi:hypothetical protein
MDILVSQPTAAVAVPTNGASIDTRGADAVGFHAVTTAVGGAGGTITIQEADDNGAGAPGAFANAPASAVVTDDNVIATATRNAIAYVGGKRWVRAVVTPNVSAGITVVAVLTRLNRIPVNRSIT